MVFGIGSHSGKQVILFQPENLGLFKTFNFPEVPINMKGGGKKIPGRNRGDRALFEL
jgi:hypothetical protein